MDTERKERIADILEKHRKAIMEEMDKQLRKEKRRIKELTQNLEDERSALEDLHDMNNALIVRERQANEELQDARRQLIWAFEELIVDESPTIGVKTMGVIDVEALMKACKRSVCKTHVKLCYTKLLEKCKRILNDPTFHPFKRVWIGNKEKEVVDQDHERLKALKQQWGRDVLKQVTRVLEELNQFNPSGRYPVSVLWHYEQKREVTLKEGIAHLTKLLA